MSVQGGATQKGKQQKTKTPLSPCPTQYLPPPPQSPGRQKYPPDQRNDCQARSNHCPKKGEAPSRTRRCHPRPQNRTRSPHVGPAVSSGQDPAEHGLYASSAKALQALSLSDAAFKLKFMLALHTLLHLCWNGKFYRETRK